MPGPSLAEKRRSVRSSNSFSIALVVLLSLVTTVIYHIYMTQGVAQHRAGSIMTSQTRIEGDSGRNPADISPGSSLNVAIGSHSQPKPGDTMSLRLVSYNVRNANPFPVAGEQPWRVRSPKLCTQLRFITAGHDNAFLCLQECFLSQIKDINARLGAEWAYVGRGRDARETDGEFSPIFYRPGVWECTHSETRWLSETPHKPSRGWDAALNRIVTIGEFTHRATGTKVVVMSTHFDHMGVKARENSARLLISIGKEWSGRAELAAVLIGGDFNSTPDDGAYQMMVAEGSGMSDISDLVPPEGRYGNHLTYTSFGEPSEWPQRIDFLFIQEPRAAQIKTFGVLANSFDDNVRISDHRPVVADMDIPV